MSAQSGVGEGLALRIGHVEGPAGGDHIADDESVFSDAQRGIAGAVGRDPAVDRGVVAVGQAGDHSGTLPDEHDHGSEPQADQPAGLAVPGVGAAGEPLERDCVHLLLQRGHRRRPDVGLGLEGRVDLGVVGVEILHQDLVAPHPLGELVVGRVAA